MNNELDEEKLIESITTVKRYGSYRIQKLWGIALIVIGSFNILYLILFETTTLLSGNSDLIYTIVLSAVILLLIGFFFFRLFYTKKPKIKDSKVVSTY